MSDREWGHLMGFTHIAGLPPCPCSDPGNYARVEQSRHNLLRLRFTCWCGRIAIGTVDTPAELTVLIEQHKVVTE